MDISKLMVGQLVCMKSGIYGAQVRVVEVTEQFVEVELLRAEGPVGLKYMIRFDTNGKACFSPNYEGNWEWDGVPGTRDFGPWELDTL